jgi:hypothetical protein
MGTLRGDFGSEAAAAGRSVETLGEEEPVDDVVLRASATQVTATAVGLVAAHQRSLKAHWRPWRARAAVVYEEIEALCVTKKPHLLARAG